MSKVGDTPYGDMVTVPLMSGTQGPQGSQGSQGNQGSQGHQGFQGSQGPQGNQGFQGVQGSQGNQGFQGTQGFQGLQGNQGFQGSQGSQGNQGFQGTQGFQGFQGNQGFQGASPTEIGYAEITAPVTVTSTSEAAPTLIIQGGPFAFDGTPVIMEFFCPGTVIGTPSLEVVLNLWEGVTNLGILADIELSNASAGSVPLTLKRRFTPTAGNHTYKIQGWVGGSGSTTEIQAGAGGPTTFLPAYLRFTKA